MGIATCGGSSSSSLPTDPHQLAAGISEQDASLRRALVDWRAGEDPSTSAPPAEVPEPANYIQDASRLLAGDPGLSGAAIPLLPPAIRGEIRELTVAARDLRRLAGGSSSADFDVGEPESIAALLGYYHGAESRHGVGWNYLAAVNLVETKFGQVKSSSVAGAQGPMQFIPSTWKIYGEGDIEDPHDAIFAAANLLRHSGAPGDYASALHSYNPSRLYVDAVQRYAGVIDRDPDAVYFLYSWEP